MEFSHFLKHRTSIEKASLGGLKVQFELAPAMRLQYDALKITVKNPRIAAVLALFYPKNGETHFLLTLRADYNGTHASQISFPGGKKEKNDRNLQQTALRETMEEVGISSEEITLIKQLTNAYIPPSNFLVTPYIGYLKKTPIFLANKEVAMLIEVPLSKLLDNASVSKAVITTSYLNKVIVPCFKLNNHVVWGATAMILNEIKALFIKL